MKAISNGISSIEKTLAVILMFAMAVIVTMAVCFRYILNSPLSWAGEIAVFLLIWISFFGGSLGLKYKSQAAVTILLDYVPAKVKRFILILGHIIMLLFLVLLIYYSVNWILSPSVAFQKSTALLIPMWIPYLAVPLGLSFAGIHLLSNLFELIKGGEGQ
ncbi:TRAP-type C4-dicarboxylate transport system permease small subunit [Bacillus pakistanensis]|uniref:TRAP-type C4-dicarboxylate transport system permease small subunit n=1 Tax=Rossellomorea pakistanensis TaxID=992288 RepID=A0ABS2N7F8_9BACI|nr:TRAP transporter small permease [Bacillus pakistanensis]MBM7583788.1 TRAP-type C4-dicarboxylate transport system permease small subunit [Bacillus pakistanensis]